MSAITAITAQNTLGVTGVHAIPADMVAAQIDAVASDIGVDAAKTGMLGTAAIVEAVAAALDRHGIRRLVVDPVMISTSGARWRTTPPPGHGRPAVPARRAGHAQPAGSVLSCLGRPKITRRERNGAGLACATWPRWAARRCCSRAGTWIRKIPAWTTCC
ncbi:bifunctional hydroxymethylpyrimidine kinase/phosphomethylpyrimidine kinase [Cupriavidus basilensis]